MALRANEHHLLSKDASLALEVALRLAGVNPEAPVTAKIASKLQKLGFRLVAGNIFELPAKDELWEVRGSSIVKLTGSEIDTGESLVAANADNPESSLQGFLYDLTF